jgi:prepilin-type N-terminal cleavage/methylation domain-containing protein
MLERIWKARRDERGFTLIELIMVLVILGILLALALPSYLGTRRKAYIAEADQKLQEWATRSGCTTRSTPLSPHQATYAGQVPLPENTNNWTVSPVGLLWNRLLHCHGQRSGAGSGRLHRPTPFQATAAGSLPRVASKADPGRSSRRPGAARPPYSFGRIRWGSGKRVL